MSTTTTAVVATATTVSSATSTVASVVPVTPVVVDDTIPLACIVEGTQKIDDHMEYVLRVQRGPNKDNCWRVAKRYSDFDVLHDRIQPMFPMVTLSLPPKKVFGNLSREFIEERRKALQVYMDSILIHPPIAALQEVKAFLDPNNYNKSFDEDALRDASMYLRSEPAWEIKEPLHRMGWRIRKHYYAIVATAKERQMLEWIDSTPDLPLSVEKIAGLFKHVYSKISNNCIYPTAFIDHRGGTIAIRDFCPSGSLKDLLNRVSKPKAPFMLKYYSSKGVPLDDTTIRRFGRQILEGLKFLAINGIPFGHLHSGNVLIDKDMCKLTDVENGLLGIPSKYRPYLVLLRKRQGYQTADLYGFGHLLFEMATGTELEHYILPDNWTAPGTSDPLKEIIRSLLSHDACKGDTYPTLDQLLENPYFLNAPGASTAERTLLKMRDSVKEALRVASETLDKRLDEEQKRASQYRRLDREEKKKLEEKVKELTDDPKKRKSARRKKLAEATAQNGGETISFADTLSPSGSLTSMSTSSSSSYASPSSSSLSSSSSASASAKSSLPRQSSSAGSGAVSPPAATKVAKAPSAPPASGAPAPPPPPPAASKVADLPAPQPARGALLSSISGFNKAKLSKTKTNDRSAPKI